MNERKHSSKGDVAHLICMALTAAVFQTLFILAIATFRNTWSEALYFLVLSGGK